MWNASPSPGVTSYDIYWGPAPGQFTNSVTVSNVVMAAVTGLTAGASYCFAIAAVGTNSQESVLTPAVCATSALPGQQVTVSVQWSQQVPATNWVSLGSWTAPVNAAQGFYRAAIGP